MTLDCLGGFSNHDVCWPVEPQMSREDITETSLEAAIQQLVLMFDGTGPLALADVDRNWPNCPTFCWIKFQGFFIRVWGCRPETDPF